MKLSQVYWVEEVPRWPEFTAKAIWQKAQKNDAFVLYFPNYREGKYPERFDFDLYFIFIGNIF